MIIWLKVTYGARVNDGAGNPTVPYSGYGFDTSTLQKVAVSGTWKGSMLDQTPADVLVPEESVFWTDCSGATEENDFEGVAYFHVFAGSVNFRTELAPQSEACGYVPPPECALLPFSVVVQGTRATVIGASGNYGTLRFSIDRAVTSQASPIFDLQPGEGYVITVIDTGILGCSRDSEPFDIVEDEPVDPTPTPTGVPVSLEHAWLPVYEHFTGVQPNVSLRLELWVETAHYAGNYQLIYQAEKPVDASGAVSFQLDKMLRQRLRPDAPSLDSTSTTVASTIVLNYFTRTMVMVEGQATQVVTRPLRSALLSALPDMVWLTTQPSYKTVLPAAPEFLYLLTPKETTSQLVIVREVSILDEYNTLQKLAEEEVFDFEIEGSPSGWRVLCIPVFLSSSPVSPVRVSIQVTNAYGEVLGAWRHYEIQANQSTSRAFLFENRCGGIDTLITKGAQVGTLEVKAEPAERGPWIGMAPNTPLRTVFDLNDTRTFRVATGVLPATHLRWLQHFMLARRIWLQVGSSLEPVYVSKRNIPFERDESRTEGLTFEYELSSLKANSEQLR